MRLICAYIADSAMQAHMVRSLLESRGIAATVENEHLQGALGDLPPGIHTSPRVLVREGDAEKAQSILKDRVFNKPLDEGDDEEDSEEEEDLPASEDSVTLMRTFVVLLIAVGALIAAFLVLAAILPG